jgi:hypothetical protein
MGHLVPILIAGDRSHPEWWVAFEWMDRLAIRSGWRSDGRIPTNAEQAKRALENWMASKDSGKPAPNMGEIRRMGELAAESSRPVRADYVEYRRQVKPSQYARHPGQAPEQW